MEIVASGAARRYPRPMGKASFFEAVRPVDMTLRGGEMTVLTGRSGSGKTTLLTMLAGLLKPSAGTVSLDGLDIYAMPDAELSRLRARRFAVVPQVAAPIMSLNVMENILFPAALAEKAPPVRRAEALMQSLDILSLRGAMPAELSGGELRRMAIVRALAAEPDFVFADEPTADLDDENTAVVFSLLREAAERGAAVLTVTHESDAYVYAHHVWQMSAGMLTQD